MLKAHLKILTKDIKIKIAFTLAEVLIALSIIGVLAAITLPSIIKYHQNQSYVAGLKKFYAVFNQALSKLASDYGCPGDLACTGVFDETGYNGASAADKEGRIIAKYFNVGKICGISGNKCVANVNPNYD